MRVIVNPASGERIEVVTSGAQTGGRLLVFDLTLPPGGHVPAGHTHPAQRERFTVLAGRISFRMGRRSLLAGPGDVVEVPPGTPHWFGNAGDGPASARVEVRPALRMEELLEATAGLATGWRVFGRHLPRLADFARFMLDFEREIAVPNVPAVLVRAILTPLARLGPPMSFRAERGISTVAASTRAGGAKSGRDSSSLRSSE